MKTQSSKAVTTPKRTRNSKRSGGLVVIAALILLGSNLPGQATGASDAVGAIRNVNVVPMDTERVDVSRTVILRGKAIERVGPAQQIVAPRGATLAEQSDLDNAPILSFWMLTL